MKFVVIDHIDTGKRIGLVVVDPHSGHAGFVTPREDVGKVLRAILARKVLFEMQRHGTGTIRVQVNRLDDRYLALLRHRLGPPLWAALHGEIITHDIETALRNLWAQFVGEIDMPAPEVVDELGNIIQQEGLGLPPGLR